MQDVAARARERRSDGARASERLLLRLRRHPAGILPRPIRAGVRVGGGRRRRVCLQSAFGEAGGTKSKTLVEDRTWKETTESNVEPKRPRTNRCTLLLRKELCEAGTKTNQTRERWNLTLSPSHAPLAWLSTTQGVFKSDSVCYSVFPVSGYDDLQDHAEKLLQNKDEVSQHDTWPA